MKLKPKQKRILHKACLYSLVLLATAIFFYPIICVILGSFKPEPELISLSPRLLPINWTLANYESVFRMAIRTYFKNSVVMASIVTVFTLALSSYTAYILTRFKVPGGDFFAKMILLLYALPDVIIGIAFYIVLNQIGLLDTYLGLAFAQTVITFPFAIWILRAYFKMIPLELDEAALMDGAGRFRTLILIVIPIALPGIVATGIFTFITSWNEFTLASILISREALRTMPVRIGLLSMTEGAYMGHILAFCTIAMIPVFIFLSIAMRALVKGLTAGAIK